MENNKGFYNYTEVALTAEEMNVVIENKKKKREAFYLVDSIPKKKDVKTLVGNNFIIDNSVNFQLFTRESGDKASKLYICRKDSDERPEIRRKPSVAYGIFRRYVKDYKIYSYDECEKMPSASALIDINPKYNRIEQEAICYDLNSAYGFAFKTNWADFTKDPYENVFLKEGQVGFNETYVTSNGTLKWEIVREKDSFCRYAFDILPVPESHKKFIDTWYSKKKNAANPEERLLAKDTINMAIGYLQNVNPFVRLLIVCAMNEYINNLLDKNSLYWNTDSIVSRVRRPDIEENLGSEIGQWKIEAQGTVVYSGCNYQWNRDLSKYATRGVSKNWATDEWDLLRDGTPAENNLWRFNKQKIKLERI